MVLLQALAQAEGLAARAIQHGEVHPTMPLLHAAQQQGLQALAAAEGSASAAGAAAASDSLGALAAGAGPHPWRQVLQHGVKPI